MGVWLIKWIGILLSLIKHNILLDIQEIEWNYIREPKING